jgi:NAD+ kinase
MKLQSIGIISKPSKPELQKIVPDLVDWLRKRSIDTFLDRETATGIESIVREKMNVPVLARRDLGEECDLIVVLGGDGTLLAAARHTRLNDVPILAVNLGGLGFLTAVTVEEIYDCLDLIIKQQHQIDTRKMLQIEVLRDEDILSTFHALNDVVLNKGTLSRILDFEIYIDRRFLNLFKADGLIVSTPTGSTAYSLAAGGPIVHPSVEAFVITPICSHTLTNRPLVASNHSQIIVVLKTEAESVFLTVDGQVGMALHSGDRIRCTLSESHIALVRPPHKDFYEVLRNKLKWGER